VLSSEHTVDVETNPAEALFHAAEGNYDLLIVSLGLDNFDACGCAARRARGGTGRCNSRHRRRRQQCAAASRPRDRRQRLPAAPVDKNELLARARTQIPKRRYTDHLRDNVQNSIEMAITDALTGLHNRRYMESHLGTLAEQASSRGKPLALMMLDIDFFKSINDNYGHDAATTYCANLRSGSASRSAASISPAATRGEEFVIVMPETDLHVAGMVAERLRRSIAGEPFAVHKGQNASSHDLDRAVDPGGQGRAIGDVLKRADTALYRAKHDGRNRVVAAAAKNVVPANAGP